MKNPIVRIIPALLLATAALAEGEPQKDIITRRHVDQDGPHFNHRIDGPDGEKEKVSFLGVETMPVDRTVAAQLGLPRDTGLVVRRVADGSPAASLLKEHDVLTKLDDQILIDMHQLGVLVRSRKAGDEVKLTFVRAGKEMNVKARLGEHEVPKMAMNEFGPGFGAGPGNMFFQHGLPPGMAGPEAGDVMRMIGGDRMHWFANPRVHVFKRHGDKGPTLLDLPSGNFVFSDDDGSVEITSNDHQRELTVKNKQGAVTFHGPLNTPEDHDKLPPEVVARLQSIGGANLGDADDDERIDVETTVLPPATKTRQPLPPRSPAEPGLRSL